MSQSEQRALVLGGGTMGVGIIAMFLAGGWKVDVVSRSASTREGLPAAAARALQTMDKPADISLATATSDLRRLLDAGLVTQLGRTRSTRYVASDELRRATSSAAD